MIIATSRIVFLIIILFVFMEGFAQQQNTLSGKAIDAATGEALPGVTVSVVGTTLGTSSNTYGFYSLTLPTDKYIVQVRYIGYIAIEKEIILYSDVKCNFELEISCEQLEQVVICSDNKGENIRSSEMSVERLDMKQVEKLPVLFGEKDILKTIQLLPGISSMSEGGSGFSVRGGSTDQNLILLDEAPVYNASHLMGFFSVFNSQALKGVSIYKGGIPAKYGGRASSVLNVSMKEGNNQRFSASGGIGLISSRFTLEGPIIKNNSSFILSARRSYADLFVKRVGVLGNYVSLYFYDLNAKVNHKINDNNRIFLSGYFGKDSFDYNEMGLDWGNTTGTFRWNHLFSNKIFSNTTIIYSNYKYSFNIGSDASMSSGIEDVGFKQDFTWYKNPLNTLRFGLSSTYHTFKPAEVNVKDFELAKIVMSKKQSFESAVYFSNNQKFREVFSLEYGLRFSMFNQIGEGWNDTYNAEGTKTDSIFFGKGELMCAYNEFEPRLSINYQLNNKSSIKVSYNRMAQYLHLLSNSTSGQPTDTWIPSTNNIKPLIATQYALGYFLNIQDNDFEFSLEAYYKDMSNIIDYRDGADIIFNSNIEAEILTGKGRSYGVEFYAKKKYGDFSGWVSYTVSRTENQIDGINQNQWYAAKYNKIHDFSFVASYQLNERANLSLTWIYYTGNAVTFPSGKYEQCGQSVPYYTGRNNYRMPDYHRLDINFHLNGKEHLRWECSWDFSLYNVYNRYNAYSITFRDSNTTQGANEAVSLSLFGIVPSVSFNLKI